MDFEPTDAERSLSSLAQRFVADTLPTLSPHPLDFAVEAVRALGEGGFLSERSTVGAVRCVSTLGAGSTSLGALTASSWLFADALHRYGGGAREELGRAAAAGSVAGTVAFGASSRETGLRATPQGDGFRLDGMLALVPNAPVATHAFVVATIPGGGSVVLHLGPSIVEAGRVPPTTGLGLRRLPRSGLDLNDARIASTAVVASGDAGRAVAEALTDTSRLLTAALALGVAERVATLALVHVASERTRPSQSTEFVLADLTTEIAAATLAVTHAAWLRDTGAGYALEAAAAKLLATRAATRNAHAALGVVGESHAPDDLRTAYLDARALEMLDGAESEQQDTIASILLGER